MNKSDKTTEENIKETLLNTEIKNISERIKELKQILMDNTLLDEDVKVGGEVPQKPREQYVSNISGNSYAIGQPMQTNAIYIPRQPQTQKILPYNVAQNKAKDTKSKLSFYITVELDLYPGTSPNLFNKSVVKCQSTFERIREAYSDLFGFQYRPLPMSEAYTYSVTKQKKEKENENENENEKDNEKAKKEPNEGVKDEKKVGGKAKTEKKKKCLNKTCKNRRQ